MATPLPPFGIRNLRPSLEPYSVLQVNEAQYASTIRTDPTATLTYIDEDDGEKVTIGSSIELKQRLQDPTPRSAPMVQCYDAATHQLDGRYVHLFDIKSSCTANTAWTELHTSYQKRSEDFAATRKPNTLDNPATTRSTPRDGPEVRHSVRLSSAKSQGRPVAEHSLLATLRSDAIPDLVDNLATLLETTSCTLRRAAEKTRESNTSPVEDVLAGMSNIVAEIGNFGLSLLDTSEKDARRAKLDEQVGETAQRTEIAETVETHSAQPCAMSCGEYGDDVEDDSSVSALNSEDDIHSGQPSCRENISAPEDASTKQNDICVFCKSFNLQCRKSPNSTMACKNCVTLAQPCSKTLKPVNPFLDPPLEDLNSSQHTLLPQKSSSILDQDTDDADFSRRYPPLMSLRRANTVAGLRERASLGDAPDVFPHDLNRHNSWAVRFPHRPVPQVLDAETQRRRDFARLCFPAQTYTPGPGTREIKVPRAHSSKNVKATPSSSQSDTSLGNQNATPAEHLHLDLAPTADPFANVLSAEQSHVSTCVEDRPQAGSGEQKLDNIQPQLPGAWPKLEQKLKSPDSGPKEESSGAFFNRMMGNSLPHMHDETRERHHDFATPKGGFVRHKSLTMKQSNHSPSTSLARSSTVHNTANPASRLNRPFDPLYPPLVPLTKSKFHSAANDSKPVPSSVKNMNEPNLFLDSFLAQSDPDSLGSSQRPTVLPRPFSPVWEDHLDESRVRDKITHSSLDHKGESTSMYSPPPRHMKSMPNFPRFLSDSHLNHGASPSEPLFIQSTTRETGSEADDRSPHNKLSAPYWPAVANTSATSPPSPTSSISPPVSVPSFSRPPHPLRHLHVDSSSQKPSPIVQSCVDALMSMGFGSDDSNLKDRLQVYAAAANGDITSAVDMIEEDKQAHFRQEVADRFKWHDDVDRSHNDNRNERHSRDLDIEWEST